MPRLSQNMAMGIAIALTCLMLLFRERWFLAQTPKGQRLVRRFGPDKALWVFRGVLLVFTSIGLLLASGILRPLKW